MAIAMRLIAHRSWPWWRSWVVWLLTVGAACAQPAISPDVEAQSRALTRAANAVLGLQVEAVEDARSNPTLGRVRQGSGVVIEREGLLVTIGYLILEADHVEIVLDDGRKIPGRVVAYDVATGFGLVQALAPLRIEPVPLGAVSPSHEEPLMVVSGGSDGEVSGARLMSRRPFAGYWEYFIDNALFTSPPRSDHSGAGLFNTRGELVGIGSLVVSDTLGGDAPRIPGNMFVPVELLRPILPELQVRGMSAASQRAWLGLNCVEHSGEVRVVRVSTDSPADVAGVQPGDQIVRIDGTEVAGLDMLWKSLWSGGLPEREVTLEIRRGDDPQTLKLHSVDRMKTLRRAQGI